jgi:hypothetical protein
MRATSCPPPPPCAHPLAHHLYPAHTPWRITPTARAFPCSPPRPCACPPAQHPYLACTPLLTSSTLCVLFRSISLSCAHSSAHHLSRVRTLLLATSTRRAFSCSPPLPSAMLCRSRHQELKKDQAAPEGQLPRRVNQCTTQLHTIHPHPHHHHMPPPVGTDNEP